MVVLPCCIPHKTPSFLCSSSSSPPQHTSFLVQWRALSSLVFIYPYYWHVRGANVSSLPLILPLLFFLTFIIGGLTASLQRQDPSTTTYAVYSILLFLFFFFPSVCQLNLKQVHDRAKISSWTIPTQRMLLPRHTSLSLESTGIPASLEWPSTRSLETAIPSLSPIRYCLLHFFVCFCLRLFSPFCLFSYFVNCGSGLVPQFQWPRSAAEHATLQPSNHFCILLWWVLPSIMHIYICAFISLLHLN